MKSKNGSIMNYIIRFGFVTLIFTMTLIAVINTRSQMTYGLEVKGNGYGLEVEFDDEQGNLFNIAAMAPGEKYFESLIVKNVGKDRFVFNISAEDTSADGRILYDMLDLAITEDDKEIFKGKLRALTDKELGSLDPGKYRNLKFFLALPAEAGNEYQEKEAGIKFIITANGASSKGGSDDDDDDDNVDDGDGDDSDIERLNGNNRVETAIAISQKGWPNGAPTVVLTREDDFPDALAGTPLAYKVNAPILLTNKLVLTSTTEEEIERLKPQTVFILGGPQAVSRAIEDRLLSKGFEVTRIGGTDRFATAALIALRLNTKGKAILAYGFDFPDTLAISPWAAANSIPILLTDKDNIPEVTQNALRDLEVRETIVIGGNRVVSDGVASSLPGMIRYGGANRYQTALEIVKHLSGRRINLSLATGVDFPDALAGSALAAKQGSFILLVDRNLSEPRIIEFTQANRARIHFSYVFGGANAVPKSVVAEILK